MWAEENGVLSDAQNGFRKGRSTIDHLSSLSTIIETRKLRRKSTCISFIDFHNAYDSVNRELLWGKLWDAGLCGKLQSGTSVSIPGLYVLRAHQWPYLRLDNSELWATPRLLAIANFVQFLYK